MNSKLIITSLLSVILTACSNTTMTQAEKTVAYNEFTEQQKLEQVDKITAFRFDSWTSLGKQHLILYRHFNEPYLVKLKRDCFDLDHTLNIGVHHQSSFLVAKYDYVVVPSHIPVRCYIDTIHKIDKEQKKALVAIGKEVEQENESDTSKVEPEQSE